MLILWWKSKKLWTIKYFWVLLPLLITSFLDFCSVTFISSVHVYSCVMCQYRKYDQRIGIKNVQFFIILSSCENWVTQISKIVIQLNFPHQYKHFEVQHAYVMIKIKEVVSNQIFLSFTACSHNKFSQFLFSYIHLICTCFFRCDMSLQKVWLKNWIQKCAIFHHIE